MIEITFFYSIKFKLIKVEYKVQLYDENNNIILPSDLILYNNIHIICKIELIYAKISINSFANIKDNNKFICSDFYNINEKVNIGIIIYQNNNSLQRRERK